MHIHMYNTHARTHMHRAGRHYEVIEKLWKAWVPYLHTPGLWVALEDVHVEGCGGQVLKMRSMGLSPQMFTAVFELHP